MKRMLITSLASLLSFFLLITNVAAQNYTLTVNVSKAGGGPALEGVTVKLNPPGTFTAGASSGSSGFVTIQPGVPQGTTDISGKAILTGVPAGNYTLAVFKNDCQTRNTSYTMPANNADITMSLNCGNSLTINVLQQQGKSGVAGAQVQVIGQSNSGTLTQMTDQSGQTVFPNVYTGTYTIKASKSGCNQSSQSFSMPFTAASNTLALNCQTNKLTVMVFEAGTLIGKKAKWIAGANVRLASPKSPNKYVAATTDNAGRAVFDNITAGAHLITTSKAGCSSKSTTYTMPASTSTVNIDLVCGGGKTTQKM